MPCTRLRPGVQTEGTRKARGPTLCTTAALGSSVPFNWGGAWKSADHLTGGAGTGRTGGTVLGERGATRRVSRHASREGGVSAAGAAVGGAAGGSLVHVRIDP